MMNKKELWESLFPGSPGPGTEEYYLKNFHLAKIREQLGGVEAFGSHMFDEAIIGLEDLGWSEDKIKKAISKEFNPPKL